jgi:hypothetical protein
MHSTLGSLGATYEVGDCPGPDIPSIDFENTSFTVRTPEPNEPVHVLMSWPCKYCRRENFGEVVFAEGCVRSLEVVNLDPSTLARLHYISENIDEMIEAIIEQPLRDGSGLREDWLQKLRAALEAGKRW